VVRDPEYIARRAAYERHLDGRWPGVAMRNALDFLNRAVAARGIEVYEPLAWHTEEN
jgi:hypothetical protein